MVSQAEKKEEKGLKRKRDADSGPYAALQAVLILRLFVLSTLHLVFKIKARQQSDAGVCSDGSRQPLTFPLNGKHTSATHVHAKSLTNLSIF